MAAVLRVVLIKLTGDRQVPSRNGVTELFSYDARYSRDKDKSSNNIPEYAKGNKPRR